MAAKTPKKAKAQTTNKVAHSFITHDRNQIDVQPMLKRVARPLGKALLNSIGALSTSKLTLEAGDIRSESCADWYGAAAEPAAYALYQLAPVKGAAAIRFNADLITTLVDTFFGGGVGTPSRAISEFSRTDMRLIHRLANIFAEELGKSWAAMGTFRCTLAGISTDAEDAQIAPAVTPLIIQPIELIYPGDIRFTIDIAYPLEMAQSAKEIAAPTQSASDGAAVDPLWQRQMASALNQVHLPARTVLAQPSMTLPQLAQLKAGDMISIPPARNLPLLIGDKIFARGSMGEQNGMAAFRIDHIEKGQI